MSIEKLLPCGVFRFAFLERPEQVLLNVRAVQKPDGRSSLQAKCGIAGHSKCSLWITKTCEGVERSRQLKEIMQWFQSGGTCTPDRHKELAYDVKKAWGMTRMKRPT